MKNPLQKNYTTQDLVIAQTRLARKALQNAQRNDRLSHSTTRAMHVVDKKILKTAEKFLESTTRQQSPLNRLRPSKSTPNIMPSSQQQSRRHGESPASPSAAVRGLGLMRHAKKQKHSNAPAGYPKPPPGYPTTSAPPAASSHNLMPSSANGKQSIADKVLTKITDPVFQQQAQDFLRDQAKRYASKNKRKKL